MWCAEHGHASCVQLLLRSGAEPSATAEGGRTALHHAAIGGSKEHAACARLLLRYGADPLQPDLRGNLPIALARESAERDCAVLLAPLSVPPPPGRPRAWPVPPLLVPPAPSPYRSHPALFN